MRIYRLLRDRSATVMRTNGSFGLFYCLALILKQHELEALCFGSCRRAFQHHPIQIARLSSSLTMRTARRRTADFRLAMDQNSYDHQVEEENEDHVPANFYSLGLGKNRPVVKADNKQNDPNDNDTDVDNSPPPPVVLEASQNWIVHEPVKKPPKPNALSTTTVNGNDSSTSTSTTAMFPAARRIRKMVARDNASQLLRGALWHERHYDKESSEPSATSNTATGVTTTFVPPVSMTVNGMTAANRDNNREAAAAANAVATATVLSSSSSSSSSSWMGQLGCPPQPTARYPNIDLSVPLSVYNDLATPEHPIVIDVVWDNLRYEAYEEAQREPLLVSFLYSTILNHPSLESSLAFCLANRLSTPGSLISTQLQSLILQALQESGDFRRKVRADLLAVRDRDPACMSLPHVFLYFKGFQALQAHRVAHIWWTQLPSNPILNSGPSSPSPIQQQQPHRRQVLAHYLQSQVSQTFQIDIHPNATMGSGIMLDHGTGIVIGETARVGDNCSILHHVTLGGSGKKGVDRHPKVGNGVLLGAGSTVLGNVHIGNGCQVGAGTLVITDLPAHCVAVGVPAKIIGQFVDVTEQPSIGMNQMLDSTANMASFATEGI